MAEPSFSISLSTKGMRCNAGLCLSPPLASVSTRHCGTLYLANGACHEQSDCQERRRNNQKKRHQGFPEHDSVTFLFKMSEISYGRSTVVARASPASSMRREVKRLGFFGTLVRDPEDFLCFKEPLRFYGQRTTLVAFRNSKATPTLCGCSKQNASSSFNLPSMVAGVMGSASGRRKGGNVLTVLRK